MLQPQKAEEGNKKSEGWYHYRYLERRGKKSVYEQHLFALNPRQIFDTDKKRQNRFYKLIIFLVEPASSSLR